MAVKVLALFAALCLLSGSSAQTLAEAIANARDPGAAAPTASTAANTDDEVAGSPLQSPPAATTGLGSALGSDRYNTPVAKYLSNTNVSTFGITWLAIEAANLAGSINDDNLAVTIFIPTNAAWKKRLPTITQDNDIMAHDLFSVGKSDALRGIMQYHILSTVLKSARDIKGALSTSSNLCSNAKDLKAVQSNGTIQLEAAGGTRAFVLDKGIKLGNNETKKYSTLFPIDDVLLPDVVTIPLNIALQAYNSRVSGLVEAVQDDAATIQQLDGAAAAGPADAEGEEAAAPAEVSTTSAGDR